LVLIGLSIAAIQTASEWKVDVVEWLTERTKKEAVVAIENVTGALLDNVNRGVAQVHEDVFHSSHYYY
jgi:hypothetical protein